MQFGWSDGIYITIARTVVKNKVVKGHLEIYMLCT